MYFALYLLCFTMFPSDLLYGATNWKLSKIIEGPLIFVWPIWCVVLASPRFDTSPHSVVDMVKITSVTFIPHVISCTYLD